VILNLIGLPGCRGAVLVPLLPTTPFLLLASACFARGSTRLHNWLQTNRVFGKYLRDYENGKGMPLRGKVWISDLHVVVDELLDLAPAHRRRRKSWWRPSAPA
jgi:uncharacterized membrane protein YbaN (DUF454 family)